MDREEGLAGSLLPWEATNLSNRYFGPIAVKAFRFASPTLVPYFSALDIKDGKSKFCIQIYDAYDVANEAFSFPDPLIEKLHLISKGSLMSNVPIAKTYNFASGTSGVLTQNLSVEGTMLVNGNKPVGFSHDPVGPATVNSVFTLTNGCKFQELQLANNALVQIGDISVGNTATMDISVGRVLAEGFSTIIIDENSTLKIGDSAELTLKPFSKLIIKRGGILTVNGILNLIDLSQIENYGGTVNLGGINIISMAPDDELIVRNDGNFVMLEGTTLNFAAGSEIKLNGPNSFLELRGKVNLAENANFTFTSDAGETPGFIRFNPGHYDRADPSLSKFITASAGAKLHSPKMARMLRL